FILIISYPLYRYLYESYSHQELLLNRQRLTEEVEQEYRLYQSVSQYHQQLAEKEQYVSLLNQQLQIIFTDNQVKPEQLQWELEQEKSIYFSVTHQV
ncbi:chromosome segregation protein, partial [Xanthomonas citri pv. citri]|nr:chromosome segregation protein [Xanthomonas citri pv. citri]